MKASKSEGRRKLTPLGYILSIGGMLLAGAAYFLLGIDRFFLGLDGLLGLGGIPWAFVGGVIWIFIVMAIVSIIVMKLGLATKGDA